jgi:murein DD-endopeptidase MepM/ murein hydrolase activator NlpD
MIKKIALLLILLTSQAYAQFLPYNNPVNGGVAIIPINVQSKPEIYYENKRVAVIPSKQQKSQWLIIVGIPLEAKDSIQQLEMKKPIKGNIPFHINQKDYTTQYLTISNKRKVDPNDSDQKRISAEKNNVKQLLSRWQDKQSFSKAKFIAPVKGRISSQFGLKRVFNNKPKNRHTGLDIAASQGTPIKATASGKVLGTGDYFYTGNTVYIDHGQGLISLYAHMHTIDVKKGDSIKQGQVIGTVGKTGRVTGPHLHWSMIMNQTLVDPLLFVTPKDIKPKPKKVKKLVKKAN